MFDEINRVIAALHKLKHNEIGLADYGKPGNYVSRQIDRWTRQYRASETEKIPAFEHLIEWLPAHIPPTDETSIVHGDYRLDNLIFHPTEPRILAVLDWELSTLGHPLADFSYHCMTWRLPSSLRGLGGEPPITSGIPTESDYLAAYCARTGREPIDPDHWEFFMAYNFFRFGAILQGIMGRVKDGTAVSKQAEFMGRHAGALAELGWSQVASLRGKA
jgi:aminoglycoside phosphotransferase (APT) family kinase protein